MSPELMVEDRSPVDILDEKDKFGARNALRREIQTKYELLKVIGRGSYGCVSKAKCKNTGKFVAIKVFEKHTNSEYDTVKLVREIILMKKLNEIQSQLDLNEENGFIPKLYDVMYPSLEGKQIDQFCIVIEHLGTDVDQLMKHSIRFNQDHLLKVLYHSLCSMAFLHEANIMHRDIKSANMLLSQDCKVKICDLGLARSIPRKFQDEKYLNSQIIRPLVQKKIKENQRLRKKTTNFEAEMASILKNDFTRRSTMKRSCSIHVGSRWYRAPEITIVEN